MQIRKGEVKRNYNGEMMALLEYRRPNDIDVIFEYDDHIETTTYYNFKTGNVLRKTADLSEWIGVTCTDKARDDAKIIEAKSETEITLRYSDGDIISGVTLNDAVNGNFGRQYERTHQEVILSGKSDKRGRNIAEERDLTLKNVEYILYRYRKCLMIRPCGFGKTVIGLKLFSYPRYKKCLFLHPQKDELNIEKVRHAHLGKKITTKTYAWLRTLTDKEIKNLDYDIVFMDEAHNMGGNEEDGTGAVKTSIAVKKLMAYHPHTHFLGATATPIRMDGIDVGKELFNNHYCYPYTDEDAFEDGILKKPYYKYCVYDVVKKIRDKIKDSKVNVKMDRDELSRLLQLKEEDINEIDIRFMDKHIRNCCEKVLPDTRYMRFIVFYLTNEDIEKNKGKIEKWFKRAYPKHEISSIVVTSRTDKDLKDVDALPTEPSDPKYAGRIDLIFNCEMLCMGYHSELITGLVMDRKTQSLSKYLQMIGRLLSCDNDDPVIIFDIVDNLHSDFVYDIKEVPRLPLPKVEYADAKPTYANTIDHNARNWEKIIQNNRKAELADMLSDMHESRSATRGEPGEKKRTEKEKGFEETALTEPKSIYIAPVHDEPLSPDKALEQRFKEAEETIRENRLNWQEAVGVLAGIEDEFGTLSPAKLRTKAPAAVVPGKIWTGKRSIADSQDAEYTDSEHDQSEEIPVEAPLPQNTDIDNEQAADESLGYNTYQYIYETGEMYSKNVQMLNKTANFEEEVKKIIKDITAETIVKAINKWHTFPECTDYQDYAEIDKKSSKYKLLVACGELYGIGQVETILQYMIERVA